MGDVLVEEKVCGKCGVKVRRDTQFCYNCGETIEPDLIPKPGVSSPGIAKPNDARSLTNHGAEFSTDPIGPNVTPAVVESQRLTSAASLRRKARVLERKAAEVVWEPAENGANVPLIIATVVLLVFTVTIVISALYYR